MRLNVEDERTKRGEFNTVAAVHDTLASLGLPVNFLTRDISLDVRSLARDCLAGLTNIWSLIAASIADLYVHAWTWIIHTRGFYGS